MQLDIDKFPLGSKSRVLAQLEGGDLNKALKSAKSGNIPISSISAEILVTIEKLLKIKNIGTILTAYYEYGVLSSIPVKQLLERMYELRDYPGYLKQAYRFGLYSGVEEQVETCLKWHEEKKLPDALAWRIKYSKLVEQAKIPNQILEPIVRIVDEDESLQKNKDVYLELRPIRREKSTSVLPQIDDSNNDPYIVSQISRNKLEKANAAHSQTLKRLCTELEMHNFTVSETKLIDAFGVVEDRKFIFEIKSITEANEREQVRKAISQLYEYRFLYSLTDATLCLVFSQKPFSKWLVDYLVADREILVLWVEDTRISGPSVGRVLS